MESIPKKVLLISYYWPPAGGVSVQRILKFCKYLPTFGWQPTVLTVKDGSYPSYDESLAKEIPASVKVHYADTVEPFTIYNFLRGKKGKSVGMVEAGLKKKSIVQKLSEFIRANLFVPDARVGWYFFATKKAKKIIEEEGINVVITTGPPHSSHLIGLYLKKNTNVKWIADFRDPWVKQFSTLLLPRLPFIIRLDSYFENKVLQTADKITIANPAIAKTFQQPIAEKMVVINNGFDEDNFTKNIAAVDSNFFMIKHIGTFFEDVNIPLFWKGVANFAAKNQQFSDKLKIELVGRVDNSIKESLAKNNLLSKTTFIPFLPHQEAIAAMINATILLLPVPQKSNNIPAKLYEYMATQNPIFCFCNKNSDAEEIIKNNAVGEVIRYDEPVEALLEAYFDKFLKNEIKIKHQNYLFYSRRHQTQKLATVIEGLV